MSAIINNNFRQELQQKLLSSQFNSYLTYKETTEYQNENTTFRSCSITGRIPKKQELEFEEFKESIYDLGTELIGENTFEIITKIFDVGLGLAVGDKYNPIDVFDGNGKKTSIGHEQGSVLLLDFWATWCKYCQEPMQENINLIREYTEPFQKNKISIVGVSTDEDQKKWNEHIKIKNWENIPHFVKPNIIKTLNIVGIPFIIIVGKDGIIRYQGHPRNINMKETLINLSEEKELNLLKEIWDTDMNKNTQFNDLFDEDKKAEMVKNCNERLKSVGVSKAEFIVFSKNQMEKNGSLKKNTQFFIQGEVLDYENELIDKLIPELEKDYEIDNITKKIKIISISITDEDF